MALARHGLIFAIAVAYATAAQAQGRGTIYLTGGAVVTHQDGPSGESPETYVTAPGGTTPGWLVGGGVFVADSVAIDAELSSTGWMTSRQPSRYGMTFNEERRDRFLAIAARLAFPAAGAVRVEPLAGVVFTWPEAWGQTERYANWLTPQQLLVVEPRQQRLLDTGLGILVGADLRIGSARVAVVPSFRLMHTGVSGGRYDEFSEPRDITSVYPGGYPEWTLRGGIAFRVDL